MNISGRGENNVEVMKGSWNFVGQCFCCEGFGW